MWYLKNAHEIFDELIINTPPVPLLPPPSIYSLLLMMSDTCYLLSHRNIKMLNFLCSGMGCFGIQENVVLVSFGFISMKKIECIPMRATQHSQNSNNYLFLSTLSFIVNFFWKVLLLCNTREIVYLFTKGLDLLDCAPHRTKRFIEVLTYSSILGYLCE